MSSARPLVGSLALAFSALATVAPAQRQWAEPVPHLRDAVFGSFLDVDAVDLNGDGLVELVWAGNADVLLRNTGRGLFEDVTAASLPASVGTTEDMLFFDADGDGDQDLYRARGFSMPDQLYLNDGNGVFTEVTAGRLPTSAVSTVDVEAGDIDGDGDADLIVAAGQQLRILINEGTGHFFDASALQPTLRSVVSEFSLRDLDRDGDLDIAVATGTSVFPPFGVLFDNDGKGIFTDVTNARLSSSLSAIATYHAVADFDGDGDDDIMSGNAFNFRLWENDGTGSFRDPTATIPPLRASPIGLRLDDVDSDGDLDVLVLYSRRDALVLWRNDGNFVFTDVSAQVGTLPRVRSDAAFVDFDGDGDRDLAIAASLGTSNVYENDGSGTLSLATPYGGLPQDSNSAHHIATGDLDGDGDIDVIAAENQLLRNDGNGRFTRENYPGPTFGPFGGIAVPSLGDVDADGDLDIYVTSSTSALFGGTMQNRLLLNDGSGAFSNATSQIPARSVETRDGLMADLDGDGDLDLFAANATANELLLNDGSGVFSDARGRLPPIVGGTEGAIAVDWNGDGALDLVLAGTNQLYLFAASGSVFVDESGRAPTIANTRSVAAADVEQDGDLDLFVGTDSGVTLLLNDGSAVFAPAPAGAQPAGLVLGDELLAEDLDRDGDIDLLVSQRDRSREVRLFLNNGSGVFEDRTSLMPADDQSHGMAAFDADRDGDLEILLGELGCPNRLYVGLEQHVHQPLVPTRGRTVAFDYYAKPGTASSTTLVGAAVSLAEGSIPLPPFGVLGLDPATLIPLPVLVIPAPGGRVGARWFVPDVAALAGLPHVGQAILVDSEDIRLTNVSVEVIR